MLRFKKIRLSGFKSFVDATDLHINKGLTGIVGPNGCGKSNLVEALRWVMGETSAKQMRGSGMEDVIFSGTATRPPRNIAEVSLILDNSDRTAPAMFNDLEDLEVIRKIERDKGSHYKVNAKDVRARDVQLLFADSATGARSTAMVSQGKIGAVIGAKPQERRMLLEEAAGITGLHSRRHEAELRLRGAESNLERLDDILITLDAQLANLKKQSRQATRYRNLSDHIRKAEATLFHLRWVAALADMEHAQAQLAESENKVNGLTSTAAQAATKQADVAGGLPALRDAEASVAAELQRYHVARDSLDKEEQQIAATQQDRRNRLTQLDTDESREKALAQDADAATLRLNVERQDIEQASEGEDALRGDAARSLDIANAAVQEMDSKVAELTTEIANMEAKRNSLAGQIEDFDRRRQRLESRYEDLNNQKVRAEAEAVANQEVVDAEQVVDAARAEMENTQEKAEAAEVNRVRAQDEAASLERAATEAQSQVDKLEAEERTLALLLEDDETELFPKLIDAVTVQSGFEAALGTALGEDLSAPADEPAPIHWRTLAPLDKAPSLPENIKPLSMMVDAPPALSRRLSQIGIVQTVEEGHRLSGQLLVGQRLVSKDGGLWRWDGFTISAGAKTAAAKRLEQRNQLVTVRGNIAPSREAAQAARRLADDARETAKQVANDEREIRDSLREASQALETAQIELGKRKQIMAEQSSKLASLVEQAANVSRDLDDTIQRKKEIEDEVLGLPDLQSAKDMLAGDRANLEERRHLQAQARADLDSLNRAMAERQRRLTAISDELQSWTNRADGAKTRIAELSERREVLSQELEALSAAPKEITARRQALMGTIEDAEQRRQDRADILQSAENQLREAEQALRQSEQALAQARESRVRAEGAVAQAEQTCQSISERVSEKLDCHPDALFLLTGLKDPESLPDLEAIDRKVERLNRERETMGPVNLRAEQEAGEMGEQIEGLQTEREDLIVAIEKLRKGIAELNREGRERLLASFKVVDAHFQELFVRLFGGGKAMLKLTDADDPLDAGLEIMASPPGKRMQHLSLLSGGEQALTALSLLFAVFQTNPAPICVLDEVDAPLDDANVDRFCSMLEEMAATGVTRFLVITHHRMTMARMERLFGVTMSERGVSQLVSVDLDRAEELRVTA